ncbi:MAG: hypothetical protein NTW23_05105 [Rhodoluna sp.]|nr:hypothetical protein [Rhodoluna sp.]
MKSLLLGFFGVFAVALGLGFLIQYPAVFWVIVFIFVAALVLGLRQGRKQSVLKDPERTMRRNSAFGGDQILEDDIVHHHQPNRLPFQNRDKPVVAPVALPVEEVDPEIENAAAMYYEGNAEYYEEEGEQ